MNEEMSDFNEGGVTSPADDVAPAGAAAGGGVDDAAEQFAQDMVNQQMNARGGQQQQKQPGLEAANQPEGLKATLDSPAFREAYSDPLHAKHDAAVNLADVAARIEGEAVHTNDQNDPYRNTFAPRDFDAEDVAVAKSLAREVGVSSEDLNTFLKEFSEHSSSKQLDADGALAALKTRWGSEYETSLAKVKEFIGQHRGLLEFLRRSPAGNSPAVAVAILNHVNRSHATGENLDAIVRAFHAIPVTDRVARREAEAKMTAAFARAYGNVPLADDGVTLP